MRPFLGRRHVAAFIAALGGASVVQWARADGQACSGIVCLEDQELGVPTRLADPAAPSQPGDEFLEGPAGITYRDLAVGGSELPGGPVPIDGDVLKIHYAITIPATGTRVDTRRFDLPGDDLAVEVATGTKVDSRPFILLRVANGQIFTQIATFQGPPIFAAGSGGEVIRGLDLVVLGLGKMPPMRLGGKRKALIPPKLAFGDKGFVKDGRVLIPPDSTIELTIDIDISPKFLARRFNLLETEARPEPFLPLAVLVGSSVAFVAGLRICFRARPPLLPLLSSA